MYKLYWDVLDKAGLVGDDICQVKNDFKKRRIFYGLFLAPKTKFCLTNHEFGMIEEQKTLGGFNDSNRLLDRSPHFQKVEVEKISAMLPKFWKKLFHSGVVTPAKMKFCNEHTDKTTCNRFNSQSNEIKELESKLDLFKRQVANKFGYMFPHFKE